MYVCVGVGGGGGGEGGKKSKLCTDVNHKENQSEHLLLTVNILLQQ